MIRIHLEPCVAVTLNFYAAIWHSKQVERAKKQSATCIISHKMIQCERLVRAPHTNTNTRTDTRAPPPTTFNLTFVSLPCSFIFSLVSQLTQSTHTHTHRYTLVRTHTHGDYPRVGGVGRYTAQVFACSAP